MDYMLELAGHPDMPEALAALRRRWDELFADPTMLLPNDAQSSKLRAEKWKTLFGDGPRPEPATLADFAELRTRWETASRLTDHSADHRDNVGYLISEHPNVWIAEVVHQFYRVPGLAADAWLELNYCDRFRARVGKRLIAQADERWFGKQQRAEAKKEADAIVNAPANAQADPAYRARVRARSHSTGLIHEPPQFINDLVDDSQSQYAWLPRSAVWTAESERKAYNLLAHPKQVRQAARDLRVPVPFSLVLQSELEQIRQTRLWVSQTADGERTTSSPSAADGAGAPITQASQDELLGLAFSGGGIRSATFNLGVLQSLAAIGLLKHCDYLSTVSGGGYIGSWFTAWMHRQSGARPRHEAIEEMQRRLSPVRNANPVAEAVRPIRYLREYSNYLTPRTGFLSADTWTMIGIFTRNALLNQVILISLFASLLLVPRVLVKIAPTGVNTLFWERTSSLSIAVFLSALATGVLIKNLQRLDPKGSEDRMNESASVTTALEPEVPGFARPLGIQLLVVLPWLLALSLLIYRFPEVVLFDGVSLASITGGLITDVVATPVMVAIAMSCYVVLLLSLGKAWRCWENDPNGMFWSFASAIIVTGAAAGAVTWAAIELFKNFVPWSSDPTELADQIARARWHLAVLGGPVAMLILSLSIVVVLGMLGETFPDEHREWWSRLRTYIHMYALGCFAWFAFALYVPWAWRSLQEYDGISRWSGWSAVLTWAGSTVAGVKAGRFADVRNGDEPSPGAAKALLRAVAFVAPYVFIVGLIVAIALVLDVIAAHYGVAPPLVAASDRYWSYVTKWNDGLGVIWITAGCFAVGIVFSARVDINAFSMHHFYKNRLVRCYLGASHEERKADWFTGFDPDDDLRLATLDHAFAEEKGLQKYPGPYPILNCALNLVGGKDLAWQERKAEAFVFTPKYCGYDIDRAVLHKSRQGYAEAYVPTRAFYRKDEGPLLGMAMAVSGAAANPNMGRATSPASAFLLTVFNARLGWWVGNTRRKSASRPGPSFGLAYTARELTGSTNDENAYVNVSDGGHFDNLGVYELIRRGCRYIIASDAGQDGDFRFGDLGDLVRRCRTDFGVEIDISVDRIRNGDDYKRNHVHCVVGTIHYLNIPKRDWRGRLLNEHGMPLRGGDRPAHETGYLIYLKPSLTGDEPHDVLEYHLRVPGFPHESTADQWFTESQFEAYRRLGMHIAECAFRRFQNDDRRPVRDIGWLFERLHKFWYPPTAVIGQHSTAHAKAYSEIMERVRDMPDLDFLDHTLFDGLPLPVPSARLLDKSTSISKIGRQSNPRDEFYVVNSLIQLMEDVYADLHLEDNYNHPHVEGWMAVFRRWVAQDAFQRTWAISRSTYAERFRRFYDERLLSRVGGRRKLTFPMQFVASQYGYVNSGRVPKTMGDFMTAIAAGAEVIELNVCRLGDATLVVYPADSVQGLPLSQIDRATLQGALGNTPVLTLGDSLQALRPRDILVDMKLTTSDCVAPTLAEIRRTAWNTERFVITSSDPAVPSQVRAIRDDVQVGLVLDGLFLASAVTQALDRPESDVDFIAPKDGTALSTDLLSECAARAMPVVPWMVNTSPRLAELFRHPAVVGIITDNVNAALQARRSSLQASV